MVKVNHQIKGEQKTFTHTVFYTEEGARYLQHARTVYFDGTFKICERPFKQLFTGNTIYNTGFDTKQFPQIFIIMTRMTKEDYSAVSNHVFWFNIIWPGEQFFYNRSITHLFVYLEGPFV